MTPTDTTAVSPTKPAEVHDPVQGESRTEPVPEVAELIADLCGDLRRRAQSCRDNLSGCTAEEDFIRCRAKANTYDHAAELVASHPINKLATPALQPPQSQAVEPQECILRADEPAPAGWIETRRWDADPNQLISENGFILVEYVRGAALDDGGDGGPNL